MNSERDEFINKFRQERGMKPLKSEIRQRSIKNLNLSRDSRILNNQRFEQLYQFEKIKQSKIQEKRKLIENERKAKEETECTFSPKLNKFRPEILSRRDLDSFSNKQNINDSSFLFGNLLNRSEIWNKKKDLKIETMKEQKIEKELEDCKFEPKIVFF